MNLYACLFFGDAIERHVIGRDSLCAIIPAAHPLALAEVISTSDLACYPMVLFNAESDLGAGALIDEFVETLGRPRIAFRASSLGGLSEPLEAFIEFARDFLRVDSTADAL